MYKYAPSSKKPEAKTMREMQKIIVFKCYWLVIVISIDNKKHTQKTQKVNNN